MTKPMILISQDDAGAVIKDVATDAALMNGRVGAEEWHYEASMDNARQHVYVRARTGIVRFTITGERVSERLLPSVTSVYDLSSLGLDYANFSDVSLSEISGGRYALSVSDGGSNGVLVLLNADATFSQNAVVNLAVPAGSNFRAGLAGLNVGCLSSATHLALFGRTGDNLTVSVLQFSDLTYTFTDVVRALPAGYASYTGNPKWFEDGTGYFTMHDSGTQGHVAVLVNTDSTIQTAVLQMPAGVTPGEAITIQTVEGAGTKYVIGAFWDVGFTTQYAVLWNAATGAVVFYWDMATAGLSSIYGEANRMAGNLIGMRGTVGQWKVFDVSQAVGSPPVYTGTYFDSQDTVLLYALPTYEVTGNVTVDAAPAALDVHVLNSYGNRIATATSTGGAYTAGPLLINSPVTVVCEPPDTNTNALVRANVTPAAEI